MSRYLIQVSFSPEYWSGIVTNPQNRAEAIRPMVEAVGGRLEELYYAVGDAGADLIMECQI